MEKGTLIIQKTSKGFAAQIAFEKDGSTKTLPISSWKPKDESLHNRICTFVRIQGTLTELKLDDGTVLYSAAPANLPGATKPGNAGRNLAAPPRDLFDLKQTRLPKDVRALNFSTIDNFNLKLNKAAYFDTQKDRSGPELQLPYEKCKFITYKTARGTGITHQIKADFGNTPFAQLAKRLAEAAGALSKITCILYESKPDWRLVVGLGNASVYETSMTLHHVYGFPYIPSSALKGVMRSYLIQEYFGRDEKLAIQEKSFCDIFGCPEELSTYNEARIGSAIFFDAYPTGTPSIVADIMNPHYGDYYGSPAGRVEAPVDYSNPIPIPFLTVANTQFQFLVGSSKSDFDLSFNFFKGTFSNFISTFLPEALREHGIGAKTAIGYGYFE
jgi:CRISPR-associated protein Cmr6